MPDLIYNVKFKIDSSSANSLKNVVDANASRQVKELQEALAILQQRLNSTSNQTKDIDKETKDYISTANNQKALVKSLNAEMAKMVRVYGQNSKQAQTLNEVLVRENQLLDDTILTLDQYVSNTDLSTDSQTALFNAIASGNTTIVQGKARLNEYNRAVASTGNQVGQMNTQFSAGNQAIFSFSDMIQDSAQFQFGFAQGMRAIGNNIGYTAELMAVMTKNARDQGMTFTQAMKSSLTGINAFIVGLNIAVTAVTMLSKGMGSAKKESEDLVKAFIDASIALENFGDFDFLDMQKTQKQIEQLERFKEEAADNEAQIDALTEFIEITDRYGNTFIQQTNSSKKAVEEFRKTLGVMADKTVRELQKEIDALNKTLENNQQLAEDNKFAKFIDDIDYTTRKVLLFSEAGLDAGQSLQNLSNELGEEIEMTKSLMSTNDEYIAQYEFLVQQYDKVENAIKAKTDAEKKEAEEVKKKAKEEYDALLKIAQGYEERRKMVEGTNQALKELRDADFAKAEADRNKKATEEILKSHEERIAALSFLDALSERMGMSSKESYADMAQAEHNKLLQTLSVNGKLKAVYEERMALMKQEQDMAKETLSVIGKFSVTDELAAPMRGSIAFLEKEIAGLESGYANVTTDAARESLAAVIKGKQEELDAKKAFMEEEKQATEFNAKNIAKSASFIADGLFENQKAEAVASAIINTYKAATQALASAPPPFGAILMGGVIASGMAQVKKIMKTKKGDKNADAGSTGGRTTSALVQSKDVEKPTQSISFMPNKAADMASSSQSINVEATVNRRGIAVSASKGNREISSSQVRP
jgi:chromosome segregation ATPase